MTEFLSTFIFIIPGILAYFWLQMFGLTPSVKHTAPEISGIAAILWLPVSFCTILTLNCLSYAFIIESMPLVWTLEDFNNATSNIFYLLIFLITSFIVSFILCSIWSVFGIKYLQILVNKIRKKRQLSPLSSTTTVWEEFFVKFEDKTADGKEALYKIYKLDKPEEYIIGSMVKGSRPTEADKSLVLEDVEEWQDYLKENNLPTTRIYIDMKSGLIVEEINHKFDIEELTDNIN